MRIYHFLREAEGLYSSVSQYSMPWPVHGLAQLLLVLRLLCTLHSSSRARQRVFRAKFSTKKQFGVTKLQLKFVVGPICCDTRDLLKLSSMYRVYANLMNFSAINKPCIEC